MDRIAREFVGLVLEVGEHDPGCVDAYYGPPQWQEQARARERELASIAVDAERLAAELAHVRPEDAWEARRVRFLRLQLEALQALDAAMPGTGSLAKRAEAQRQRMIAPVDKVDAVFRRQIDECRARTLQRLALSRSISIHRSS